MPNFSHFSYECISTHPFHLVLRRGQSAERLILGHSTQQSASDETSHIRMLDTRTLSSEVLVMSPLIRVSEIRTLSSEVLWRGHSECLKLGHSPSKCCDEATHQVAWNYIGRFTAKCCDEATHQSAWKWNNLQSASDEATIYAKQPLTEQFVVMPPHRTWHDVWPQGTCHDNLCVCNRN